MFKLKYKITDADMRAVNKRSVMFYFWLYLAVAVCGIAVGITAVVLNPQKLMFVLGIILLVFGGLLTACALLLLVAPKDLISSAFPTGDEELDVTVDKHGITAGEINIPFADIKSVKDRKSYLLVSLGKYDAVVLKDCITSGQTFAELSSYVRERAGRILLSPENSGDESGNVTAAAVQSADGTASETVENTIEDRAAEE